MLGGGFKPCGEPPVRIPRCIGRAVNGLYGCTCFDWTAEHKKHMRRLGGDFHDGRDLRSALREDGMTHRETLVVVPYE